MAGGVREQAEKLAREYSKIEWSIIRGNNRLRSRQTKL